MTRPTLEQAQEFDPTTFRGMKWGVTFIGNVANFAVNAEQSTLLVITPTGAQNVLLPLESLAASKGLMFLIVNAAAGAFALTIQTSVGGALPFGAAVLAQNQMGLFVCDGVQWHGMVASATMTSP